MASKFVLDSGLIPFEFRDKSGKLLASFELNPTDVNVAARCGEVSRFFEERAKTIEATVSDAQKYDAELTEKLNYLLGYPSDNTIFNPPMSATTILPNGDIFAAVIVEKIAEAVEPEIKKRSEKMQKAVSKYTEKYSK